MTQILRWSAGVWLLVGCGEIASVNLDDRPNRAAFTEVREVLLTVGCSGNDASGGCHAVLTGNLQISIEEPAPLDLDQEFLQIKSIVDLDAPEESRLLKVALPPDEPRVTHSICFDAEGQCAYSKLLAWISGQALTDVDCTVETNTCHF